MMQGWVMFQGGRTGIVSISNTGLLRLSSDLVDYLGSDYVILLYHRDRNAIGISPSDETKAGAYKLRAVDKTSSRVISVVGFMKNFDIERPTKAQRYKAKKEDDMIVAELDMIVLDNCEVEK